MEVFLVVVFIVILIWIFQRIKSGFMDVINHIIILNKKMDDIERRRMEDKIQAQRSADALKAELKNMQFQTPPAAPKEEYTDPVNPIVQQEKIVEKVAEPIIIPDIPVQKVQEETKTEQPKAPNFIILETKEEKTPQPEFVNDEMFENIKSTFDTPPQNTPTAKKEEQIPHKTFFENNPDLEKFIGENLINKIGIAILVLGIAFFVKYAIDEGWINEIGRVAIGILTGGILIGIAHLLQKNFKAFSSVLIGGGLTVFYFTIGIAFHTYHLFSQEVAFIIMVIITGFAVVLTMLYNRLELAVIALIGGFATPFILSTGEGNYKILFTYLIILNAGMLVIAFYKKWNLVNILCFLFTIFIFGGWLSSSFIPGVNGSYLGAFFFATCFYLLFFLMNILYNIKNRKHFKAFEISLLLGNTALYYGSGMYILHFYLEARYQGLFTVLMGIFNLVFVIALIKRQDVDKNLVQLLIGIVLMFVSLAAPVQLEGHYITLFWAAESAMLLWFSQKSQIKLIKGTSLLVGILMLISLLMDWGKIYGTSLENHLPILLNKAFITSISSLVAIFLSIRFLKEESEENFVLEGFTVSFYRRIMKIIFTLILFLTFFLELYNQISTAYNNESVRMICISLYSYSFLIAGYIFINKRKMFTQELGVLFLVLSLISLFLYIGTNHAIIEIRAAYLFKNEYALFFYLHLILMALISYCIFIFNQSGKKVFEIDINWIKWVTVILIVALSSAELNHLIIWISNHPGLDIYNINQQIYKTGYSVLWGLLSFVFIQQGMKRKDRNLRIIALSLFAVTILKLFIWDLQGISEGGKIIAFILLGALLLVVSFMYQKLKQFILDDKTGKEEEKI